MDRQVLEYRRPATGKRRPRPVLGGTSCVLALAGATFVALPVGGYAVLNALGAWALAYFAIGVAFGVGALLRGESRPSLGLAGVCLHVLTAGVWFSIGGSAYFGASP